MTMYLTIDIPSGGVHEHWSVTNVGHPYDANPGELDDLRRYQIERQGDSRIFVVDHRRSSGRHTLAAQVFARVATVYREHGDYGPVNGGGPPGEPNPPHPGRLQGGPTRHKADTAEETQS